MVSETRTDGRCNAPAWLPGDKDAPKGERTKSGYCEAYPVTDDEGEPLTGTCKQHNGEGKGGAAENNQNAVGNDGGAPEGNGNAIDTGAYSERPAHELYDALDEDARTRVDELVRAYTDAWDWPTDHPERWRLVGACVDIWRAMRSRGRLVAEGPSEERVIGVNDYNEPIYATDEHHLNQQVSRLNTDIRQTLSDLRALEDGDATAIADADGLTVNVNVVEYDGSRERSTDDGDAGEVEHVESETVE